MQMRENMSIEESTNNDNSHTRNRRKTYNVSRLTIVFVASIFLCSIIATALLIYNFATCSNTLIRTDGRAASDVIKLDNHDNYGNGSTTSDRSPHDDQDINRNKDNVDLRLPRSIVPIVYDIKLIPYLFRNNFTFAGEVRILLNVTEKCQNITLHTMDLSIADSDVQVRQVKGDNLQAPTSEPLAIGSIYSLPKKHFYVIQMNDTLLNGSLYSLEIKYIGILNDIMQGFYRSSYTMGNETR